jgi:GPH family glycoside/pentoside/hexuronide:cation symporter
VHAPAPPPPRPGSSGTSPAPAAAAETSLGWQTQAAYGAGGVLDRLGAQGLKDLGNPVFNLILGINPVLIGWTFVGTRLWDAFTDPLMGTISDNARTRWGRRRPFMLAGTLLSALAIVPIFWMPAGMGFLATAAWMSITGLLFFTAFTIFDVPYRALAYELAPGYHGKTQLLAVRTAFAMLVAALTPWIFPLAQSGWLGSPRESLPWIACGLGLIVLLSGLIPTLLLKESAAQAVAVSRQRQVSFREGIAGTLSCRPFTRLLAIGASAILGVNLGFGFGNYVIIYHVYGGDRAGAAPLLGWYGTAFVGMALCATPLIARVARSIGKRNTLMLALSLSFLGSTLSWWLFSPQHPWTSLIVPLLFSPGTVSLWMLGEAMVADVSQASSERSGVRMEARFSSVFAWVMKTATAVAILGSNLLLNLTGFDVLRETGQSAESVLGIRLIYLALPASGFLVSLFLLRRFRDHRPAPHP